MTYLATSKTSIAVLFLIACFVRWSQCAAASDDEGSMIADSQPPSPNSVQRHDQQQQQQHGNDIEDADDHKMAQRAMSLSHKYVGLGRRSSLGGDDDDEFDEKRGVLPSSLRFTGLGKKRRQGVSAAMRYAGLGKRFPESPSGPDMELIDEPSSDNEAARLLNRRRRFAVIDEDDTADNAVFDADDVPNDDDYAAQSAVYGIFDKRQPSMAAAAGGKPRIGVGMRYVGVRKRKLVNVRGRVDAGMRYMGIGKRGSSGRY